MYQDRTKNITAIVIFVTTALLVGYDIWVVVEKTPGDTISELIRDWSYHTSTLPYLFGVLVGHWFFNWNNPLRRTWTPLLAAIGLLPLIMIQLPPYFVVAIGVIAGALFWTLEPSNA